MKYYYYVRSIGAILFLWLPMLCFSQTDTLTTDAIVSLPDTVPVGVGPVEAEPDVKAPAYTEPAGILAVVSIGYLSYDSALAAMPGYAMAQARLKELRQAYEKEMKRVEDEFNRKYEDFLEGQRDFPRTILLKRQTELQEMMQRNVEFKRQGLKELADAETEALAPLREELKAAIAVVAKRKGLALVVNTDSNACPFIDPDMGVDIQTEVHLFTSSINGSNRNLR